MSHLPYGKNYLPPNWQTTSDAFGAAFGDPDVGLINRRENNMLVAATMEAERKHNIMKARQKASFKGTNLTHQMNKHLKANYKKAWEPKMKAARKIQSRWRGFTSRRDRARAKKLGVRKLFKPTMRRKKRNSNDKGKFPQAHHKPVGWYDKSTFGRMIGNRPYWNPYNYKNWGPWWNK